MAIENSAQLILVVDARAGVTPLDAELARLLRRTGRPFAIAANKVDAPSQAAAAAPFFELAKDVFPISAEHGLGVDELLDAVTSRFPPAEEPAAAEPLNIAIIGRPNVGKSTLLNQLVGEERSIVSPEPGTTRDAVDTILRRGDRLYRFIDTAGIRRKGKTKLVAEKLSVVMARKHLERADIALMVMDAEQGVTSSDATIASYAQQSGRSLIIVMNKWDLALHAARRSAAEAAARRRKAPSETRPAAEKARGPQRIPREKILTDPGLLLKHYEEIVRQKLKFVDYAPVVFLAAKTGERVGKLFPLMERVAEARQRRISTAEMNRWLESVDLERGTIPFGKKIRIYYITQAGTAPPSFVLFTNQLRPLHFSYARFLENELRKHFDFTGTPLHFITRLKAR